VRIALGTFACSGIKAHVGGDIEAAVDAALLHYTQGLKSGRAPIELPRFCRREVDPQDAEVALDLTVDRECEELLEREAARQASTVSRLANHAVLIYLAELDFLAAVQPQSSMDSGEPR
jgi:hypothetical protein